MAALGKEPTMLTILLATCETSLHEFEATANPDRQLMADLERVIVRTRGQAWPGSVLATQALRPGGRGKSSGLSRSDDASYVNAETLMVDGGATVYMRGSAAENERFRHRPGSEVCDETARA